jgi:hypothetical protein
VGRAARRQPRGHLQLRGQTRALSGDLHLVVGGWVSTPSLSGPPPRPSLSDQLTGRPPQPPIRAASKGWVDHETQRRPTNPDGRRPNDVRWSPEKLTRRGQFLPEFAAGSESSAPRRLSMETDGIKWPRKSDLNRIASLEESDATRIAIGPILRAHARHWFACHHKTAHLSRASHLGCWRYWDFPYCDSEHVRRPTRLNQAVSNRIVPRVCCIAVWSSSFRFCTTSKPRHRSIGGRVRRRHCVQGGRSTCRPCRGRGRRHDNRDFASHPLLAFSGRGDGTHCRTRPRSGTPSRLLVRPHARSDGIHDYLR